LSVNNCVTWVGERDVAGSETWLSAALSWFGCVASCCDWQRETSGDVKTSLCIAYFDTYVGFVLSRIVQ